MNRKTSIVTNLSIALVLGVLSLAIFTTDLSNIYLTVSAPLYNGNRNAKNVSFMINVCDGTEFVNPMLDILNEKNAEATFFIGGAWAADINNVELLKKVSRDFEVGNHAYSHKNMKGMSALNQRTEIKKTHDLVKALTGVEMHLFAPPSGSFGKTTLKIAEELSYTTIMWSKDTGDNRDQSESIYTKAITSPSNGDIILLHPTAQTVAYLAQIIDFYQSEGFNIVEISKNIA